MVKLKIKIFLNIETDKNNKIRIEKRLDYAFLTLKHIIYKMKF